MFTPTNNNIIDKTEATGLRLLGMMQSSRPVDGHVIVSGDESPGGIQRGSSVSGTELIHP